MRVWYRKPGQPAKLPKGLEHVKGNEYFANKRADAMEVIGADPVSWTMEPVDPATGKPVPIQATPPPAKTGPAGKGGKDEDDDGD